MPAPVRFAESLAPLLQPIDSVRQHPSNPRNGDIDKIVESVRVNGFLAPIIVQRSTGYILAGNHRWQALHSLGASQVPVVWADVDDEQALRYLIADNATSDAAMNDMQQLAALLAQLQDTDLGLVGTAVSNDEYERMLLELSQTAMPDDAGGFGAPGPLGLYQVVLEFDNEQEMEAASAHMSELGYESIREVRI